MRSPLNPPLVPKDGNILKVLVIARISSEHQDKRSLNDQIAKIKEYLAQVYEGPVEWTIIQSQGSGEQLDRKELIGAEDMIEIGLFDLVIAEDLARICRRRRAYDFCEHRGRRRLRPRVGARCCLREDLSRGHEIGADLRHKHPQET